MAPRPGRQPVAGDRDELAGRHVEQDGAGRRELGERRDPMARDDLAAGRLQLRDERVGDRARPAADHRPADRVGVGREDEPERGTQRAIEAEHRVGRDPPNRARAGLVAEPAARQPARRPERRAARTGRAPAGGAAGGRPAGGAPARASRRRARAARTAAARRRPSARRGPSAVAATDRSRTAARPPSSGWATGASGWMSSTPRAARSIERKNGEAIVSGRIVEQTSWRNPGRVSSAVRVPPPAVGAAS